MFIGMSLVTPLTSLVISTCLYFSAFLTNFLMMVTPSFMLSRMSWTHPSRTIHIFDIMWVNNFTASAPISSTQYVGVSFYVFTRCTTPKHIIFVMERFKINAAVDFSGSNSPMYDLSDIINMFPLLMDVSISLPYTWM